ncbi:MAG: hypothetical protein IIU58_05170, partial [Clostridia bacterium]|nr:hypothetical protein [Clostridia bacterium]
MDYSKLLSDKVQVIKPSGIRKFFDMLGEMKDAIGSVNSVRFTTSLKKHAVCLTSDGELSVEMEKILKKMP